MITREQIESYELTLEELNTAALGDLRELMDGIAGLDADTARELLFDTVPAVFDPYALTASNVSASFYEESRALAGSPTPFTPQALAEPVAPESWRALVGVATDSDAFTSIGVEVAFDMLAGGLVKRLTESAAETVFSNGVEDPDPVAYQRVPKAGCCGFCGMLASRGAAYGSREQAGRVVGRGMPISKTRLPGGKRKSGGQAKGVKSRGTQKAGERFHDNCKCVVVAVHAGNAVEMAADQDKYYEAYREAAGNIDDGLTRKVTAYDRGDGTTKNRYSWVNGDGKELSPKQRERAIMQAMNQDPGVMDAIAADAYGNRPPAHPDMLEAVTLTPSTGPLLSYENTADLSDDELMEAMGSVFADDPEAWDKLEGIMETREARRLGDLPEPAPDAFVDPFGTVLDGGSDGFVDPFGTVLDGGADAVTNPTLRKERKLTPNEKVAEEYWDYAQTQYQTALEELNGVLFNSKFHDLAREKGISEDSLFTGPFHVANKYASDELREWWRLNGRETQTSYRYQALGRPSDYKAWQAVQKQGLHATGIRSARREDRRGL